MLDGIEEYAEYDAGSGARLARYDHDPSRVDALLAQTGASGTTHYAVTDALGSVYALTDDAGASVTRYSYDVYGERSASTESVPTKWGFTGRVHEQGVPGAMYYRAREYDAGAGRFLRADPFGTNPYAPELGELRFRGRWTTAQNPFFRYLYAGGNPVNYRDPNGLISDPLAPEYLGWAAYGTGTVLPLAIVGGVGLLAMAGHVESLCDPARPYLGREIGSFVAGFVGLTFGTPIGFGYYDVHQQSLGGQKPGSLHVSARFDVVRHARIEVVGFSVDSRGDVVVRARSRRSATAELTS